MANKTIKAVPGKKQNTKEKKQATLKTIWFVDKTIPRKIAQPYLIVPMADMYQAHIEHPTANYILNSPRMSAHLKFGRQSEQHSTIQPKLAQPLKTWKLPYFCRKCPIRNEVRLQPQSVPCFNKDTCLLFMLGWIKDHHSVSGQAPWLRRTIMAECAIRELCPLPFLPRSLWILRSVLPTLGQGYH